MVFSRTIQLMKVPQPHSSPNTKISEAFLRFVEPLIEPAGLEINKEHFSQALEIGFLVWNSVVYDNVAGNDEHVSNIRKLMSSDPAIAGLINELIRRKKTKFSEDDCLIGQYELRNKNGEWNVWAEARSPYK